MRCHLNCSIHSVSACEPRPSAASIAALYPRSAWSLDMRPLVRGFSARSERKAATASVKSPMSTQMSGGSSSSMGRAIRIFSFGPSSIALALALAILIGLAATALGATPPAYDDVKTAEGWAWSRIKQGDPADFGDHCGGQLDPKKKQDPRWRDLNKYRTISAAFLVDILTRSPLRGALTYKGLEILGAKIVGDVDLSSSNLDWPLGIRDSRFEGAISLSHAAAEKVIDLSGSSFRDVTLSGARVTGDVQSTAILTLTPLQVGGSLFMSSDDKNRASFQNVNLLDATVAGTFEMIGAQVEGVLDASRSHVGASLFLYSEPNNQATLQKVSLLGAKVAGDVDLIGAEVNTEAQ
jgi:hypothetical protein